MPFVRGSRPGIAPRRGARLDLPQSPGLPDSLRTRVAGSTVARVPRRCRAKKTPLWGVQRRNRDVEACPIPAALNFDCLALHAHDGDDLHAAARHAWSDPFLIRLGLWFSARRDGWISRIAISHITLQSEEVTSRPEPTPWSRPGGTDHLFDSGQRSRGQNPPANTAAIILTAKTVIPTFRATAPGRSGIRSRSRPPAYEPAAEAATIASMIAP